MALGCIGPRTTLESSQDLPSLRTPPSSQTVSFLSPSGKNHKVGSLIGEWGCEPPAARPQLLGLVSLADVEKEPPSKFREEAKLE